MNLESTAAQPSYCYSCGGHRTEDQLGTCLKCGWPICGLNGCSSLCACDDAQKEAIAEIDEILAKLSEESASGNALPAVWNDPGTPAKVNAIMRRIDGFLSAYSTQTATA